VLDDVVVERKMRLESQLLRMNCQMFSTGMNSGDFGGSGHKQQADREQQRTSR
jgi:hypothetical protein